MDSGLKGVDSGLKGVDSGLEDVLGSLDGVLLSIAKSPLTLKSERMKKLYKQEISGSQSHRGGSKTQFHRGGSKTLEKESEDAETELDVVLDNLEKALEAVTRSEQNEEMKMLRKAVDGVVTAWEIVEGTGKTNDAYENLLEAETELTSLAKLLQVGDCTVLYCTVLYCTVLYCTVLYWTQVTEVHEIQQWFQYCDY